VGAGLARYKPQNEAGILDKILSKPGFTLALLLVPERFMNRGSINSWLSIVLVSFVFYTVFFWPVLTLIGRFTMKASEIGHSK
jgi:hypothetical protein